MSKYCFQCGKKIKNETVTASIVCDAVPLITESIPGGIRLSRADGLPIEFENTPIEYEGHLYCRPCAHNLTHLHQLQENEIPCPVFDGETGKLIPFGTYPNIDWS